MTAIRAAIQPAIQPAIRGVMSGVGGTTIWSPTALFAAGEQGVWYDPSDLSTMFQDSAGATPVTATGQTVGKILDKSGNGKHATQSTAASRPILGRHPVTGLRNLLLATDTMSTQSATVTAVAHTLSFTGTGTVTLTGTSTAGPLVGTGAGNRVSLTFTPTAGSLTMTVSGSVTFAQLEIGSAATAYQKVVAATEVTEAGVADAYYLKFDGVDDQLATAAIDMTATDKASLFFASSTSSTANQGVATFAPGSAGQLGALYLTGAAPEMRSSLTVVGQPPSQIRVVGSALGTRDVYTQTYDIAGTTAETESQIRKNGAVPTQMVQAVGPAGTGNFGSGSLVVGQLASALFLLAGRLYGLVLRGAASSATQIAQAESYMAAKSGVTLP